MNKEKIKLITCLLIILSLLSVNLGFILFELFIVPDDINEYKYAFEKEEGKPYMKFTQEFLGDCQERRDAYFCNLRMELKK